MIIERTLADWVASHRTIVSERARDCAKYALVDITACILGGAADPATQAIARVAASFGSGDSLAMGTCLRLPAPWAAFVSGTAAHALDFDDNLGSATTHATAILAPALFALADQGALTGGEVIDAYIIGIELQARIGRLVNPAHYELGWHATSTVGTIGTAGACARLLRLDAGQALSAMSIAFSLAAGSKKQFGTMMKPIHAGLAAKNAVLATLMARGGITANTEPLGGPWGFADLYASGPPGSEGEARALAGLGDRLVIESEGLMQKRFPCCAAAHRTLDGLLELRDIHRFSAEQVDHVDAFIPSFARANLRFDVPTSVMEARFSLTYCAARALAGGRLTLSDMTAEAVNDPSIQPWLNRIRIHTKPGSVSDELGENATPAVTRIALKDGSVHETGVTWAKGSAHAPLSTDEVHSKFRDCCHWAGLEKNAEELFRSAGAIRSLTDFRDFTDTLETCSS